MWVGVNDPPLLLVRCFACQVVLDGACYGCGTSLRKFFITTNKIQLGGFMFFVRALLWQAIYVLCQAFVTRLATFQVFSIWKNIECRKLSVEQRELFVVHDSGACGGFMLLLY